MLNFFSAKCVPSEVIEVAQGGDGSKGNFDCRKAASSSPKVRLSISKILAVRMSCDSRTIGVSQLEFVSND